VVAVEVEVEAVVVVGGVLTIVIVQEGPAAAPCSSNLTVSNGVGKLLGIVVPATVSGGDQGTRFGGRTAIRAEARPEARRTPAGASA
jgi:hypothetical protein